MMAFELADPQDDGLLTSKPVGVWSRRKHHFLRRYIDGFTTAMKSKPWAGGLHYVDLFSESGILMVDDGGLEWGSPLIAAQAPHQFSQLHLCEKSKTKFDALRTRLARFPQPSPPQMLNADANVAVEEIVASIPSRSLTLAFLDPYGLHLDFETIAKLSAKRADLIIFFPDHVDALRNWENVYAGRPDSNLDRYLGTPRWIDEFSKYPRDRWAERLQKVFEDQLRRLGYSEFEHERIGRPDGVYLYKLIFCAKHEAASTIWRGISKREADGQGRLF